MHETQTEPIRSVSLQRAGELYRAMNGDPEAQKVVTLQDVVGLVNAPVFEKFLLWNRNQLEIRE